MPSSLRNQKSAIPAIAPPCRLPRITAQFRLSKHTSNTFRPSSLKPTPNGRHSPILLAAKNGHLGVLRVFTNSYIFLKYGQTPAWEGGMDYYHPLQRELKTLHDAVVGFLFHHLNSKRWAGIFSHAAEAEWSMLVAELLPLFTDGNGQWWRQ